MIMLHLGEEKCEKNGKFHGDGESDCKDGDVGGTDALPLCMFLSTGMGICLPPANNII